MMLSTSRTKTNNKNNAHFKLLISSFLSGRVLKEEVEESLRSGRGLCLENIQKRPTEDRLQ